MKIIAVTNIVIVMIKMKMKKKIQNSSKIMNKYKNDCISQ